MKRLGIWFLRIFVTLTIIYCLFFLASQILGRFTRAGVEAREFMGTLQSLKSSHADRETVTHSLGLQFTECPLASDQRRDLEHWLAKEPHGPLQGLVARYSIVLYHTTMDEMTWLFFDSENKLQDFYICSQ